MAHLLGYLSARRVVFAICALTLGTAQAAHYCSEGRALDLSEQEIAQLMVSQSGSGTDAKDSGKERAYVQIDDMIFPVVEGIGAESAFLSAGTKWADNIVYYEFDENVNAGNQQRFRDAADLWVAVANLTFIEGQGDGNYIHVQDALVNNSMVGMVGGQQTLNMYNWNVEIIIAHEIGHALGLMHEQSRSDRDDYVTILYQNIEPDARFNFDKANTINYGEYDFDSIMHYSKTAFSINGENTIEPLPEYSEFLDTIGQRGELSELDKDGMAAHYGAPLGLVYVTNAISDATSNGNDDGEVNPGETIEMAIAIANTSDVDNNNVIVKLSTTNTWVGLDLASQTVDLLPAQEGVTVTGFQFTVAQDYPSGEPILFDISITSDEDSGADSFLIPVTGVWSGAFERVVNGNFSRDTAGWMQVGDFYADDLVEGSRSVPGHAYLADSQGRPGNYLDGELSQWVDIPSDRTQVTLSYWYRIDSTEIGNAPYDFLTISVFPKPIEEGGDVTGEVAVAVSQEYSNLVREDGYNLATMDLSQFAGGKVLLSLAATTDSTRPTSFRIDDVSVLAIDPGPLKYVDHIVYDGTGGGSGNGDGEINPGETIDLAVVLSNPSTNQSTGILGTLTCTSPDITITDSNVVFSDIGPESEGTSLDVFAFDVATTAVAAQTLEFTLQVTSDQGDLQHTFSIVMPGTAELTYAGNQVIDGMGGGAGNGDGNVDPGEDIVLDVDVFNVGPDQAVAVAGVLSSTSEWVNIQDDHVTWGDIPASTTKRGSDFDFTVSWEVPVDTKLPFTLVLSSGDAVWTNTFTVTVGGDPIPPDIATFERTGDTLRLQWSAEAGTPCRVLSTPDLTEPAVWTLEEIVIGIGEQTTFETELVEDRLFFRVEYDD